ncbi:hypothetical protein [Nocardia sp. NPDC051750]|uniref:hypothetical protein n=1 Tax=Nocardia sp. NPDC051750 TaxID=3364325 RepID=UPI00378EBEC2
MNTDTRNIDSAAGPDTIRHWQVDWTEFRRTHPEIHGDLDSRLGRLGRLPRTIPIPTTRSN